MKTIKCSKCEKDVQVDDSYSNLCCPICLAKRKANYQVASAERNFERESEKQLKALFGDNPPIHLSFGNMQEFYRTHFRKELTWEQYLKNINDTKLHKIQQEADSKVRDIRGEKQRKIMYDAKFLDFDMYPPSNRNECKKYRHMAMGSYPQNLQFLEEHVLECGECRLWKEVLDDGVLVAENSSEIWHSEPFKQIKSEPLSFEEWEGERLKDVPKEQVNKALTQEYHLDQNQNQPN